MKLAAAQINSQIGQVKQNLNSHYLAIETAAKNEVDLVIFPEMSITGYCREEGRSLAFEVTDPRLDILKLLAAKHRITIIAGAPISIQNNLYIGSFILQPGRDIEVYTKQHLHDGEELFYQSSFDYNPLLHLEDERLALAICADIDHLSHPKAAKEQGSTIYLPSIFFSREGIESGHEKLSQYASTFSLPILMSNYCGNLWNMEAGGKSAFWNENGKMLAELDLVQEGLLIVEKNQNNWKSFPILQFS